MCSQQLAFPLQPKEGYTSKIINDHSHSAASLPPLPIYSPIAQSSLQAPAHSRIIGHTSDANFEVFQTGLSEVGQVWLRDNN